MAELQTGSHEVDVEHITLKGADGAAVDAIHARPDGMPVSGLVLHTDIMGIRPLFDDLCRRLATHGFAVCAPEPFATGAGMHRIVWSPTGGGGRGFGGRGGPPTGPTSGQFTAKLTVNGHEYTQTFTIKPDPRARE